MNFQQSSVGVRTSRIVPDLKHSRNHQGSDADHYLISPSNSPVLLCFEIQSKSEASSNDSLSCSLLYHFDLSRSDSCNELMRGVSMKKNVCICLALVMIQLPLVASAASTSIDGTANNDVLVGTSGIDFIDGQAGNDVLSGLGGQDVFMLEIGGGDDVVTDLKPSTNYNKSEKLVFGGHGPFVAGDTMMSSTRLPNMRLVSGMSFETASGDILTITDVGNDVVFSWSTGESFTVLGLNASRIIGTMIHSF